MPLNSLKNRTWILVADGARALLIRNEGSATQPKFALIRRYKQENPATREQGTDRPGRTNDAGTHKSAMEPTDWHQIAEDRFVHELAEVIGAAFQRNEFELAHHCGPADGARRNAQSPPRGDQGSHSLRDQQGLHPFAAPGVGRSNPQASLLRACLGLNRSKSKRVSISFNDRWP